MPHTHAIPTQRFPLLATCLLGAFALLVPAAGADNGSPCPPAGPRPGGAPLGQLDRALDEAAAADDPCDGHEQKMQRFRAVQAELDQLDSAMPFAEQFDLVKGTIDEINEVMSESSKDLKSASKKIKTLREQLGLANDELEDALESRVWARSIARTPGEGRGNNSGGGGTRDGLGRVGDGLDSSAKLMDDVAGVTKKAGKALDVLDEALEARDGTPSEQLLAFQKYFTTLTDELGPLVDRIPGLGTVLELYANAIGSIAGSVASIEEGNRARDKALRDLGFDNISYNWPQTTPTERLAQKRNALRQELEGLADDLADCARARENTPDPLDLKIASARDLLRQTSEYDRLSQAWNDAGKERDKALDTLHEFYERPTRFDPVRYGEDLDTNEELDLAARRHARWKREAQQRAARFARMEQRAAALAERLQQLRDGKIRLSLRDQIRLNEANADAQRRLPHVQQLLADTRQSIADRDAALAAATQGQQGLITSSQAWRDYQRQWLRQEADAKKWPRWRMEAANTDLFPNWYRRLGQNRR